MNRALLASIASDRRRWTPASLSPALWLRADLGVTLASGDVAGWASSAGAGTRTFSQSTAGARPLYSATGGPNGQPYVELGGARWMQGDGAASLWSFLHTGALTVWCVAYKVGTTADITAILATQASASHKGALLTIDNTSSLYRTGQAVYAGTGVATPIAYATSSNNAAPSNAWRAIEWSFAPTSAIIVQSAGSLVHLVAGAWTAPTGDPTYAAQLGRAPMYTFGSAIRVCEIIAIDRVASAAELATTRAYLRARYGVAA